jgi:N-acetylmuramoyl-L-alanine amidase
VAMILVTPTDLWTVAQTLWGEARSEGYEGMAAVAHVLVNRAEIHQRWKSMPLVAICRSPRQFDCWDPGDVNRPLLDHVSLLDAAFTDALLASVNVLSGRHASNVGHATHYHRQGIPLPRWAQGQPPCAHIGRHLFYENIA